MSASPSLGLAGKLFLYGIIGLEVNLLFKQETQVHNKQKILVQLKMKWMRLLRKLMAFQIVLNSTAKSY
ncbi:hypothetical protein BSn5_08495 [Bacillus subtilis BSn5]|nr:hypothetical protein BSn5_08495 [Bacillus subtilis BSn5]